MTVFIRRVSDDEYRLERDDGVEIATYNRVEMTHPNDWIQDARDADEPVHGPYDWEYIDERGDSV